MLHVSHTPNKQLRRTRLRRRKTQPKTLRRKIKWSEEDVERAGLLWLSRAVPFVFKATQLGFVARYSDQWPEGQTAAATWMGTKGKSSGESLHGRLVPGPFFYFDTREWCVLPCSPRLVCALL